MSDGQHENALLVTAIIATTRAQAIFLAKKHYIPSGTRFSYKRQNGLYVLKARGAL